MVFPLLGERAGVRGRLDHHGMEKVKPSPTNQGMRPIIFSIKRVACSLTFLGCIWSPTVLAVTATDAPAAFPRPLTEYPQSPDASLFQIVHDRAMLEPFNVV